MNIARTLRRLAWLALAFSAAPTFAAEVVKIGFIDVLSGPFALAGEGSLKQLREVGRVEMWRGG